jgi:hypothetical protein
MEFPLPLSYTHRQHPPTHVLGLLQYGSCICFPDEIQRLAYRKLQCEAVFCATGRIAASNSATGRTELFNARWSLGHYMYSTVVTIYTDSGHCMYSTVVTIYTNSGHCMYSPVVTICTILLSPFAHLCGHYIYSPVVTVRTAQWSPNAQASGHHMYSPVVTISTAQWSLYLQPSGQNMYSPVATICTTQWSIYIYVSPV